MYVGRHIFKRFFSAFEQNKCRLLAIMQQYLPLTLAH